MKYEAGNNIVLGRRSIENYLFDNEVIQLFVTSAGRAGKWNEIEAELGNIKRTAAGSDRQLDDLKALSGLILQYDKTYTPIISDRK